MREIYLRFISSLVFGPIFLACIFLGSYFLAFLILIMAFIISWEWVRLTIDRRKHGIFNNVLVLIQGLIASMGIVTLLIPTRNLEEVYQMALILFIVLIVGMGLLYIFRLPPAMIWGVFYVGAFVQSFVLITLTSGALFMFRLITLVWACDVGGYFFGNKFKGPKLMPSISPNKTWIGCAGSLVSVFVMSEIFEILLPWYSAVGSITTYWSDFYIITVVICAILGDLFISFLKRRAGVDSTGSSIPGHGGLLDRFDSLIAVLIFTALIQVGESLLRSYA